jgi:hypothetical protein
VNDPRERTIAATNPQPPARDIDQVSIGRDAGVVRNPNDLR